MNSTPGSFTSGRRADFVIHLGAALALGLALAGSQARAGVPLPAVAEVASVSSLATVVKEIAPAVVAIEASRTATGRTPRNAIAPRHAGEEGRRSGSGVVFDAERGLIITNSHV